MPLETSWSQDGVVAGGVRRVPESTPTISAMDDNTLVRCPADGSTQTGGDAGHTERYSPPGPNLHAGSIRPILCVVILDTLAFRCLLTPALPSFSYRPHPRKNPNKTRTNLRQGRTFLRKPSPPNCPPPLYGTHDEKKCHSEAQSSFRLHSSAEIGGTSCAFCLRTNHSYRWRTVSPCVQGCSRGTTPVRFSSSFLIT